ncbi:MAG: ABC transporter ATP-binding protein [Microvirga sp.]
MTEPLLSVQDLSVAFRQGGGDMLAVDRVSFDVMPGETVALVGESGSGKSVTALSALKLLPYPSAHHPSGRILFKGKDLIAASESEMRAVRGDDITMVFQEPQTALNPVRTVGWQLAEALRARGPISRRAARARAVELLETVGIPEPHRRVGYYPHQLSGGQKQRVVLALALANEPELLLADEPTTALDVTVQAQILRVLLDVRDRFGMAIMLITHDLGVVAGVADRVVVMYAGQKIEEADVHTIYGNPKHPYTWGLLGSTTRVDRPRLEQLTQIPGAPPSLLAPPAACRFAPRCAYVQPLCRREYPELRPATAPEHLAACHFAQLDGWEPGPPARELASRQEEAV